MKYPWSDMPAWLTKVLADSHPSGVVQTVEATYKLRGVSYTPNPAGDRTVETVCRWVRDGSRLVDLSSPEVLRTLAHTGDDPPWHNLAREGRTCVFRGIGRALKACIADGEPDARGLSPKGAFDAAGVRHGVDIWDGIIALQPSVSGLRTTVWWRNTSTQTWQTQVGVPETLDPLTWHFMERGSEGWENLLVQVSMTYITAAAKALAAILEAREVLRQAPRQVRRRRQRVRTTAPSPLLYHLDQHGLSAWTERHVRQVAERERQERVRASHAPPRVHSVGEHCRRVWVRSPRAGEVVIAIKGHLFCVKRRVTGHARGSGIAPRDVRVVNRDS